MTTPSIFSRILLVVGALSIVGTSYWFITTSLAPAVVPEAPPARGAVRFDPRVDVSKNPSFLQLYPLGPMTITLPTTLGRTNPFATLPSVAGPTGTSPIPHEVTGNDAPSASSTASTTIYQIPTAPVIP